MTTTTRELKREVSLGLQSAIQAVVEFERLKQEAAAVSSRRFPAGWRGARGTGADGAGAGRCEVRSDDKRKSGG